MIEATAILNSDNETVYKVGDNIFSSIEEIFHDDEYTEYICLNPVDKMNLIQNIQTDAIDFLYPEEISYSDVKDAFDEYLASIGNDALYISYTNDDLIYIRDRRENEISSDVLDILKNQIEG